MNTTKVMGILNVTPDSFSDGGSYDLPDRALAHAVEMQDAGADWIDIGAESTRPGFLPLSVTKEWSRLENVLPLLLKTLVIPVSIDTYKADIAARALELGVAMVNDVWGGLADPNMFKVVAESNALYVLMHNSTKEPFPGVDPVRKVREQLERRIELALAAGMEERQIILDPGIGFGKTQPQNLMLINRLNELKIPPFPLLIGPSRKSVIGHVLDLPVEERQEGTAAAVAVSIARGVDFIRVHDVRAMARVARMADAIVGQVVAQ